MKFDERLQQQGPALDVEALPPTAATLPFAAEMCLPRLLMWSDSAGPTRAVGVLLGEVAPLVVGGLEGLRVLLALRDLLRDVLAQDILGDARELGQALRHLDGLLQRVESARLEAQREHRAYHEAGPCPGSTEVLQ